MPGPFVGMGCNVMLNPGASGPPDMGVITIVAHNTLSVGAVPVAVSGSLCLMTNTITGMPYTLPVGPLGSTGVSVGGNAAIRVGDQIPSGPGILLIIGPPLGTFVNDGNSP